MQSIIDFNDDSFLEESNPLKDRKGLLSFFLILKLMSILRYGSLQDILKEDGHNFKLELFLAISCMWNWISKEGPNFLILTNQTKEFN